MCEFSCLVVLFTSERCEASNWLAFHLNRGVWLAISVVNLHDWRSIQTYVIRLIVILLFCSWCLNWFVGIRPGLRIWQVWLAHEFTIDTAFNGLVFFAFPRLWFSLLYLLNLGLHFLLFGFHILQVFLVVVSGDRFWEHSVENSCHLVGVLMVTISASRHYFKNSIYFTIYSVVLLAVLCLETWTPLILVEN